MSNAAAAGVRGGRAKEGEEGKLNHYRDLITNFDALSHHFQWGPARLVRGEAAAALFSSAREGQCADSRRLAVRMA